jgi:preprotein translocase subunit YajC
VLPWIVIGVLFYLMLIRPERRKRAELDQMLRSLKKNDRVVTAGGIFGTVVQASQDADEVTLRVDESNNTRIRVLRSSISRVITPVTSSDSSGSENLGST